MYVYMIYFKRPIDQLWRPTGKRVSADSPDKALEYYYTNIEPLVIMPLGTEYKARRVE